MATHSSILAWRIPWTDEPGGLQGVARVRHDLATKLPLPTILVNFQEDCLRDETLLALGLFLRRPNQIFRKTSGDGDGRQP